MRKAKLRIKGHSGDNIYIIYQTHGLINYYSRLNSNENKLLQPRTGVTVSLNIKLQRGKRKTLRQPSRRENAFLGTDARNNRKT